MNTDDKLQHFLDISMSSAMQKKSALVEDYKAGLDIQLENHKKDALTKYNIQEKTGKETIRRELSKDFTSEQQHIKRQLAHKKEELTESLFTEVQDLLNEFFKTEDYTNLLTNEIKSAVTIAPDELITIYIDPLDASLKNKLESETGVELTISEYSFGRGMRAIIPSKNILIDNSFDYKINELKSDYTINL